MKKLIGLIFICSVILFSVCGCGNTEIQEDPNMIEKYNEAVELMEKETTDISSEYYKYESAKKIFDELGDFRDSIERAEECYTKSIPIAIQIGEKSIADGDIWSAKNLIEYRYKDNMPNEIKEFLQKDIFNLIGDWKLETNGTSLRIDLKSKMGNFDLIASNGSTYNTGYWKIKDNGLYFCDILLDEEDDSNYKKLFTIVSYDTNTLTIKNSQQSFTLTK